MTDYDKLLDRFRPLGPGFCKLLLFLLFFACSGKVLRKLMEETLPEELRLAPDDLGLFRKARQELNLPGVPLLQRGKAAQFLRDYLEYCEVEEMGNAYLWHQAGQHFGEIEEESKCVQRVSVERQSQRSASSFTYKTVFDLVMSALVSAGSTLP